MFEITKEFKEFKFKQNFWIAFTEKDKVFKNKKFADPWFGSENIKFNNINIDELLDVPHNHLSSRVESWEYEGSGWATHSILLHQLVVSEIALCERRSYFLLPNELRKPMKGLINIQNEDNECFRCCLVRYLNHINKDSANIRNVDKEFVK